ncbi:MAG: UDP-N-acetylmuramoyl-tripeptide--D-alanyl-D-alanine ligase [Gammaproteobacteria bacterium]
MKMRLSEIQEIVGGVRKGSDEEVESVTIDTRKLQPGDCYVAIRGQKFDGNDFVGEAENSGAVAAILEREANTRLPRIIVEDTRRALAEFARAWRQKADVRVIGITGSNGKTTVKEMTAAILGKAGRVLSTRGNLNNDIGVPLTLLKLDAGHRYAVVEMGANHPGEIAYLCRYAIPDVAVITNVGPAHIEGFGSIEGVARAKGEMVESLAENGVAVLNADDVFFPLWKEKAGNRKIIAFGLDKNADVRAGNIRSGIKGNRFVTDFTLIYGQEETPIRMSLAGTHNVVNALAACAACLAAGADLSHVREGLLGIQPVPGRLEPMPGAAGGIIINDTYNANPASLKAALDVLMTVDGEPWVVLGAFGELGKESLKLHEQMGEMIKSMGVVRLLATGPDAESTVRAFGKGAGFFPSQQELIESLENELTGREAVLVKGSRSQKMEKVTAALTAGRRG